jgi:hypothetical protein
MGLNQPPATNIVFAEGQPSSASIHPLLINASPILCFFEFWALLECEGSAMGHAILWLFRRKTAGQTAGCHGRLATAANVHRMGCEISIQQ